MAADRYERRHRRTAKNIHCIEVMANADFDAVPSLAEAMGLEEPTMTPTPKPRNLKAARTCRYCGHRVVAGDALEQAFIGRDYSCRDIGRCAGRIRQGNMSQASNEAGPDDLPF